MSILGFANWLAIFFLLCTSAAMVPYGRRGLTMLMVAVTSLWMWGGIVYVFIWMGGGVD